MLALYHEWDSVCSFKVRMCLAEKQLDWESRRLDLPSFEHLQPAYLSINPNGVVPTLVHDDLVILESSVINEYLDEVFPEPALRPANPYDRARMRVWAKYEDDHLHHAVRPATFQLMIKLRLKRMSKEELDALVRSHPKPERAHAYREWATGEVDMEAVQRSRDMLSEAIQRMDDALSGGTWLAGEIFSLADCAVAPFIDRIEHLRFTDLWQDFPRVVDWVERVKARASYAKASPPDEFRLPAPERTAA